MKKLLCMLLTVAMTLALCGFAMAEIAPVKMVIYSPIGQTLAAGTHRLMSSLPEGATISDVSTEIWILWLHVFLYFWLACVVYGYQIYLARHDAFWRYIDMKRRRQQRQG